MASPFSATDARLAGLWAAGQAQQGLAQTSGTLLGAKDEAGGYLTGAYGTAGEALGAGYADALTALSSGYGAAPGYLQNAETNATNWLTGGRDQAMAQLEQGRTTADALLRQGEATGTNWLTGSRDLAQSYLNQASGNLRDQFGQGINTLGTSAAMYDPLIQEGMAGYDMLSNALGLGGAEGTAAAQSAFQEGPGYQWMVDQTTDAAQRAANRTGQLYGGNTTDAVARLGSNLANQEYQNWIKNLQPYQGATLAATQGKAGVLGQMAGMYGQLGTSLAGVDQNSALLQQRSGQDIAGLAERTAADTSNLWERSGQDAAQLQQRTGQDVAGLIGRTGAAQSLMEIEQGKDYAQYGTGYADKLAQLAGGYGSSMAGLATGTAGAIAGAQQAATNATTEAGTNALLAGQQASQNTWGAILGAAGLGTKLLSAPSSSTFGSLITSLFGKG